MIDENMVSIQLRSRSLIRGGLERGGCMSHQTNRRTISAVLAVFLVLMSLLNGPGESQAQSMSSYNGVPPFVASAVAPNILFILDNSGSMNNSAYTAAFNASTVYSGAFRNDTCYSYASGVF